LQQKTAEMGIGALKKLVENTAVNKLGITIMPGCGINKSNITTIVRGTRAVEFHASASVFEEVPVHRNVNCSMGTQDDKAFMVSQETVAYLAAVVKCHKMDGKLGLPEFEKVVDRYVGDGRKQIKEFIAALRNAENSK
jgi:copper homeostasis protein CutC